MKLSIIIPAHNAHRVIVPTVEGITGILDDERIDYEVVVVADDCTDQTVPLVIAMSDDNPRIRYVDSPYPPGYGYTIRAGLEQYHGDAVVLMMADGSDSPRDLVSYYRLLMEGYDCVFGSRFLPASKTRSYPPPKLVLNRIGNFGIRVLFGHGYNDTTNAFKAYRREVIDLIQPLLSAHFNLTVEMPLKAIVRGASYAVVPIDWTNRSPHNSRFHIQEAGSRYLFISLYVFFEHHLSGGDYRDPNLDTSRQSRWRSGRPNAVLRDRK